MLLAEINWRVRAAVYETLLGITIHFKRADLFTTTIQPMFLGCLKDRVQTIREFGINSIRVRIFLEACVVILFLLIDTDSDLPKRRDVQQLGANDT